MSLLLAVLTTVWTVGAANAQHFKLLKTQPVALVSQQASVDRYGHIFVSSENGTVYMFKADGTEVKKYSSDFTTTWTVYGWETIRTILFSSELQKVEVLNRQMTRLQSIDLNELGIGYATCCSPSTDGNLWVFDQVDRSLKKVSYQLGRVVSENPLTSNLQSVNISNPIFIQEYQNRLYIADSEAGVMVFDNMGTFEMLLTEDLVEQFGFWKNQLYYSVGDSLKLVDLYLRKVTKKIQPQQFESAVLMDSGYLMGIKEQQLWFYRYSE
ncbi:hypothetical protein V6R21_27405 [Limibacter armeniacum]|uniref:hypothetical protein n=1 Tax=Limibacter armeniacum TaxID=466084 RepID=UPI002FE6ACEB